MIITSNCESFLLSASLALKFDAKAGIHRIRMEYHLLFGQGAQPRHFMFIGSGPLPLSSLTLASQHLSKDSKGKDWSVFNIDMCPHANKLGSDFARKLFPHYMDNVTFLDCNATDIPSDLINKFDVIYLAALVVSTRWKRHDCSKGQLTFKFHQGSRHEK